MPGVMTETVPHGVYERLARCPWVRPEAVARGRKRLHSRPLPSGEAVAASLLAWVLGGRTH
jgi:hypothetical protein